MASPVVSISAMVVIVDTHEAHVVKSCSMPLSRVPVALNCCVVCGAILTEAGVTAIAATVEVLNVVKPERPPNDAVTFVGPIFAVPVATP